MPFGVTIDGFILKRDSDIIAELQAAYKSIYGDINVSGDSVFGQEIGIKAKLLADVWEVLQACYNAYDPNAAAGAALDNVLALALLSRQEAIKTTVVCTCTGTPATVIPSGSQVSNTLGDKFESIEDLTIAGGGTVDGTFRALVAGAVPALLGTVTTIETPVSGWASVDNAADGTVGRDAETDVEARLRRNYSLQYLGAATLDAIRAAILNDVDDVTACIIYENDTDVTDFYGQPPHSIWCIVSGGTNQDIADKIWEKKAAGIKTFGNTSVGVFDSLEIPHTVAFSRPTQKYVHVKVTIDGYYAEEDFPADGDDQIKEAIVAYGENFTIGQDIILQRWNVPVFSVPGIQSVTIEQDVTDNPGDPAVFASADIPLGKSEIANMDVSRITVVL